VTPYFLNPARRENSTAQSVKGTSESNEIMERDNGRMGIGELENWRIGKLENWKIIIVEWRNRGIEE